jgi:hypothetical protein
MDFFNDRHSNTTGHEISFFIFRPVRKITGVCLPIRERFKVQCVSLSVRLLLIKKKVDTFQHYYVYSLLALLQFRMICCRQFLY